MANTSAFIAPDVASMSADADALFLPRLPTPPPLPAHPSPPTTVATAVVGGIVKLTQPPVEPAPKPCKPQTTYSHSFANAAAQGAFDLTLPPTPRLPGFPLPPAPQHAVTVLPVQLPAKTTAALAEAIAAESSTAAPEAAWRGFDSSLGSSILNERRERATAGVESFEAGLNPAVDYIVLEKDDSAAGRVALQQRGERTTLGYSTAQAVWDDDAAMYRDIRDQLPSVRELQPGQVALSHASSASSYRTSAAFVTVSSLRSVSTRPAVSTATSAKALRAAELLERRPELHHRRDLAFLDKETGLVVMKSWAEFVTAISPGNMKGKSSHTIGLTRVDTGSGYLAHPALLAKFPEVLMPETPETLAMHIAFLDRTAQIQREEGEMVAIIFELTLLPEELEAMKFLATYNNTPSSGHHSNICTSTVQSNITLINDACVAGDAATSQAATLGPAFSAAHQDPGDCPFKFTAAVETSNLPPGSHHGATFLLQSGLMGRLRPGDPGVFIFSGRELHKISEFQLPKVPVPLPHPLRPTFSSDYSYSIGCTFNIHYPFELANSFFPPLAVDTLDLVTHRAMVTAGPTSAPLLGYTHHPAPFGSSFHRDLLIARHRTHAGFLESHAIYLRRHHLSAALPGSADPVALRRFLLRSFAKHVLEEAELHRTYAGDLRTHLARLGWRDDDPENGCTVREILAVGNPLADDGQAAFGLAGPVSNREREHRYQRAMEVQALGVEDLYAMRSYSGAMKAAGEAGERIRRGDGWEQLVDAVISAPEFEEGEGIEEVSAVPIFNPNPEVRQPEPLLPFLAPGVLPDYPEAPSRRLAYTAGDLERYADEVKDQGKLVEAYELELKRRALELDQWVGCSVWGDDAPDLSQELSSASKPSVIKGRVYLKSEPRCLSTATSPSLPPSAASSSLPRPPTSTLSAATNALDGVEGQGLSLDGQQGDGAPAQEKKGKKKKKAPASNGSVGTGGAESSTRKQGRGRSLGVADDGLIRTLHGDPFFLNQRQPQFVPLFTTELQRRISANLARDVALFADIAAAELNTASMLLTLVPFARAPPSTTGKLGELLFSATLASHGLARLGDAAVCAQFGASIVAALHLHQLAQLGEAVFSGLGAAALDGASELRWVGEAAAAAEDLVRGGTAAQAPPAPSASAGHLRLVRHLAQAANGKQSPPSLISPPTTSATGAPPRTTFLLPPSGHALFHYSPAFTRAAQALILDLYLLLALSPNLAVRELPDGSVLLPSSATSVSLNSPEARAHADKTARRAEHHHAQVCLAAVWRAAFSSSAAFVLPFLSSRDGPVLDPPFYLDDTRARSTYYNKATTPYWQLTAREVHRLPSTAEAVSRLEAALRLSAPAEVATILCAPTRTSLPLTTTYPRWDGSLPSAPSSLPDTTPSSSASEPTARAAGSARREPAPGSSSTGSLAAAAGSALPTTSEGYRGAPRKRVKGQKALQLSSGSMEERRARGRKSRNFLNYLLLAALTASRAASRPTSSPLPPLPPDLQRRLADLAAFAPPAPLPDLRRGEAHPADLLARHRAAELKLEVERNLTTKPYRYQPLRRTHPHRLWHPNLDTQPFAQRVEHTVRVRLGLIGAEETVYRSFPPEGLNATNIGSWTSGPVNAQFQTHSKSSRDGGRWGTLDCYGQYNERFSWVQVQKELVKALPAFVELLETDGSTSFAKAIEHAATARLPMAMSKGSLSCLLLMGDLVEDGLIRPPTWDVMGANLASVSKGAVAGLAALGFLLPNSKGKFPAKNVKAAFETFMTVLNAEESKSGISNETRTSLLAVDVDLACPILGENLLCKVARDKWGAVVKEGWLEGSGVGWIDFGAAGWPVVS